VRVPAASRRKHAAGRNSPEARTAAAWVWARRLIQYLTLAAFLVLFIVAGQQGAPGALVNLPMRLDPLLVLSQTLASRTLLAGSALALLTIALTLVFGRAWCGWICPLGTTLDILRIDGMRGARATPSQRWRSAKYILLLVTLVAAALGSLTLLFLDPLAILTRTLAVSGWPAADRVVVAAETALYQVPGFDGPIAALDSWLRPAVLPLEPQYYRGTVAFAAFFVAIMGLDLIARRFWCRYLCPLGGLLGLISKLAPFRRRLKQECKGCTLCTDTCPTGTIDPAKGYASNPGECTMCLDCLEACPRGLTTFRPGFRPAGWNDYDPGRREALLAAGSGILLVALFRSDAFAKRDAPTLVRPPGFGKEGGGGGQAPIDICSRCGECLRVCPTGGLQPAVMDAGVAGLGSPVLISRLGYCDYSCNACGQACPVAAIRPLSLGQKRLEVIGWAYIDQDRCIAWADHAPCIVCEEMCPLPEKAIQFDTPEMVGVHGLPADLRLPRVLRDVCIGCGICEYQCPVVGESAIRVYGPQAANSAAAGGGDLRRADGVRRI
jgi:polyferredoxin